MGKRIVREMEILQLLLVPGPKILKAKVGGGRLVLKVKKNERNRRLASGEEKERG